MNRSQYYLFVARQSLPIVLGAALSAVLLLIRIFWSHHMTFSFLFLKLVLAMLPLFISYIFVYKYKSKSSKWTLCALFICWLFFLLYALYVLTDLIHYNKSKEMPVWFDAMLLLSFAFTCLYAALISFLNIQMVLRAKLYGVYLKFVLTDIIISSAFGIYLSRFLNWNSWKITNNPNSLLDDIAIRFLHPFDHLQTWIFTFLLFVIISVCYALIERRKNTLAFDEM